MRWMALSAGLLLLSTPLFAAKIRGHYSLVGTKPESHSVQKVIYEEIINFGCAHCNNLRKASEELRKQWGDRVEFVDIPITFRGQDDSPLRLYYVAQSVGKGDLVRTALFDARFVHGVDVFDAGICNYLARSLGLGAVYSQEKNKPWVNEAIQAGIQKSNAYGVTGTPSVILMGSLKMDIGRYGSMADFTDKVPETFEDLLTK